MTAVAAFGPVDITTAAGSAEAHDAESKKPWLYAASLLFPFTTAVGCVGPTTSFAVQPISPMVVDLNWTTGFSARLRSADFSTAVRRLKDRSGLSWQQLGDAFGVSRRSLHFWVNGGNLSDANVARLRELTAVLDSVGLEDPKQVRTALLTPGDDGTSLFARVVHSALTSPRTTAADHLDSIHDTTQHRGKVRGSRALPVKLKEF